VQQKAHALDSIHHVSLNDHIGIHKEQHRTAPMFLGGHLKTGH
jgi:hypothetical protein